LEAIPLEERVQRTTEVPVGHTGSSFREGRKVALPGKIATEFGGHADVAGDIARTSRAAAEERAKEREGEREREREREREEEKREIERERKRKRERRWTRHGALSSVRTRASKPAPLGESRAHKVEDRREEP